MTKEIIRWILRIDDNDYLLSKQDAEELKDVACEDLLTIDELWSYYSRDKFGFSIQEEIWINASKDASVFADEVGWKTHLTQGSYDYDLRAPRGHLPSSNWLLKGYPINNPADKSPRIDNSANESPESQMPFAEYPTSNRAVRVRLIDSLDLPMAAYIEIPEKCTR